MKPTFKQFSMETSAPATNYGYWIKPDGSIIPVAFEGQHYSFAEELFPDSGDPIRAAFNAGGIRVVSIFRVAYHEGFELDADWFTPRVTRAALNTLMDILVSVAARAHRRQKPLRVYFSPIGTETLDASDREVGLSGGNYNEAEKFLMRHLRTTRKQ